MPKLIISERGRHEDWTHDVKEQHLSIGRHDENVIALPGRGVSRRHARIERANDDFFLYDMDSGNGTFLNGIRLNPGERYLLKNKDAIVIDTFNLIFYTTDELLQKSYNEEITDSEIIEVKLLKKVLKAIDKDTVPSFEVLNGSAEGEKFHLTDDVHELVIGRDPDNDFPINEHVISRQHAKVVKRWGGISIRDLESKNGTFVNNRRVVEEYLHDGDRIALGTIVLIFRNPQEINLNQMAAHIPPKNKPASVAPEDVPAAEPAGEAAHEDEERERKEEEHAEQPAEEQFEQLADRRTQAREAYPAPPAKTRPRFSPIEIGMMGLGALVFIFALITIVNLIFA